jgi:hypothetical protein
MGMIGYAQQVSIAELQRFQREPDTVASFVMDELDRTAEGSHRLLDLEKLWHVLHYLLAGSAVATPSPLGNSILGGREIGDDLGYGPARFLDPEQVRGIAAALEKLPWEEAARRFDPDAMLSANVYLAESVGLVEALEMVFGELVSFYSEAASHGNAVLLYIV